MSKPTAYPLYDDRGKVRTGGIVYYSIEGYPTAGDSMSNEMAALKFIMAFKKWEEISNFTFVDTKNAKRTIIPKIDITIKFGKTGFDTKAETECNTFNGTWAKSMLNVITFDEDRVWVDMRPKDELIQIGRPKSGETLIKTLRWLRNIFASDLLTIAVHEIGHALGLEHDEHEQSIMNERLIMKDYDGYMSTHDLSMHDAIALGKIYKWASNEFPPSLMGIKHFLWVGGEMAYSDRTSKAIYRASPDYYWGEQTTWKVEIGRGYSGDQNRYHKLYAYLKPSNSSDLENATHVVCGGATFANGNFIKPWGLWTENVGAKHLISYFKTYVDGDRQGQNYVCTAPIAMLRQMPRQMLPDGIKPWCICGGLMDVRNNKSDLSTRKDLRVWGNTEMGIETEIASFRSYYDSTEKYRGSYGRIVLKLESF